MEFKNKTCTQNKNQNEKSHVKTNKKNNYNTGRISLPDECFRTVVLEAAKRRMLPKDYLMMIISNELAF